uniref:Cholinephosphotransferase 1 n=1 Tax=Schistosoma haematobium TaxID=6185 RepID=A0A095A0T0_SCHHA
MAQWMVGKSISKDQLNRLLEHKYHCEGESICDNLLKDFWRISSLYIPRYIAPNTLTLLGFLANVFALCLLLSYGDPLLGLELKVVQFLVFSVVMFFLAVQFADTISQGGCGKYGTTVAVS